MVFFLVVFYRDDNILLFLKKKNGCVVSLLAELFLVFIIYWPSPVGDIIVIITMCK